MDEITDRKRDSRIGRWTVERTDYEEMDGQTNGKKDLQTLQ